MKKHESHSSPSPRDALDEIADELDALDESKVAQFSLDAAYASSVALAASEACKPFEADIAKLPKFDAKRTARIPLYARALTLAHAKVNAYSAPSTDFEADIAKARPIRESLLSTATTLGHRNKIPWATIERIREGTGHRDLIDDLAALVVLLTPFAGGVADRDELATAQALVDKLSATLVARSKTDETYAALLMQRRKVASLLLAAYRDLTAAMEFLRREEKDSGKFVPSLYFTGTRESSREPSTPTPPPAPKPADPVAPRSLTHPAFANEPSDSPFIDEKK
jgi:hypothetical protein